MNADVRNKCSNGRKSLFSLYKVESRSQRKYRNLQPKRLKISIKTDNRYKVDINLTPEVK